MSQKQRILDALKQGRKLTPADAVTEFRCYRLAAHIHQLRKEGWSIETRDIPTGKGPSYAEYSLEVEG